MIKKSDLDGYLKRYRREPMDLDAMAAQAVAEIQEGGTGYTP
jgi:hypothetical protein